MLRQQLTDGAHELAPSVNLKELRPPQGALLVNPIKLIADLCHSLASQGLSLFVADGDVNNGRFSVLRAQSVFETILPAQPAAVRLLSRDACALR